MGKIYEGEYSRSLQVHDIRSDPSDNWWVRYSSVISPNTGVMGLSVFAEWAERVSE